MLYLQAEYGNDAAKRALWQNPWYTLMRRAAAVVKNARLGNCVNLRPLFGLNGLSRRLLTRIAVTAVSCAL